MIEEIDVPATGESEVASEATDLRSIIEAARDKQRENAADVSSTSETQSDEPVAERKDGRDEKGRFKAAETHEPAPETENEQDKSDQPDATDKTVYKAPVGWSVAAKAQFNELPDAVKESIAKREAEVDKGFARYGGLKQYAEIAEENGTTLAAAVQDYAKIEDNLRKDYLSGIDFLNGRFGINPHQFIQAYAARYGVDLSNVQQSQGYQPPAINPDAIKQQAKDEIFDELMQRETLSEINRFRNDPAHPYFENVREDMSILLQNGKAQNLADAYEMACWANPETRAIMLKSQTNSAPNPAQAVQKAKAAAKAIGGAPSPGFNPSAKHIDHSKMSLRETIEQNVAAQRG